MIPDNKPGEHSIRMTMEELFRLQGINISMKSSDIKAVVPTIVAMLKLKLPDIPTEKLELQTSERVSAHSTVEQASSARVEVRARLTGNKSFPLLFPSVPR